MNLLKKLNLRLFDGDGGSAAGSAGNGTGASESGGNEMSATSQTDALVTAKRKGKANPLANVKYGIQPQEAQTETVEETEVETAPKETKSFEELIKGEYKKDFDERVQNIINQRFKDHKSLQEKLEKLSPLEEFLTKRYGKEAGDYQGMLDALLDEDALFEQQAISEGKSTDELKQKIRNEVERDKFRRENEALRQQLTLRENQEREAESQRLFQQDVEKVKQYYPNFDVASEMQNPKFVGFLRAGVDMKGAYEATHMDELMRGALHYTAQKVTEQVVNNVKAKAARPAENGVMGGASAVTKTDVSKLTKADRAEISKRIARGERISFG